jgi:hypothetical protein
MISVKTFLTHDNVFSLVVSRAGTAINLISTGVTRVVVTSAAEEVDSDVNAAAFDFATDGATGVIEFDFADLSPSLSIGKHKCDLTIFDPIHPDGQVWEDAFTLHVKPAVVA